MIKNQEAKTLKKFEKQELEGFSGNIQDIITHLYDDVRILKFVLNSVPVGIFIYQPNIVYANNYTLQHFKIDAKELSLYTPAMLLDKSTPQQIRQELVEGVGIKNYELRLNVKGAVLDVIAVFQTIVYKEKPAGIVWFIDNTKFKKIKEEFSELLHHLPLVMYQVHIDKDQNYHATVSDAVKKLTGFSKKEVESNPLWWQEHIHESDRKRVLNTQDEFFQKGYLEYEYRFRCKDGSYIWVDDRLVNLSKGHKNQNILGFWNDITVLKLHEFASQAIAKINQHFFTQKDEEKILFCICKHFVESKFCEQVILTRQSGERYRYPEDDIQEFVLQKQLQVAYAQEVLEIVFYFQAKITQPEVFEGILEMFKNNVETGFKAFFDAKALNYLTYHEVLCNYPNDNALRKKLKESREPFALLIINIRSFSSINLLYGFSFGNKVLCAIADVIKNSLAPTDSVYHLTGDKFCMFVKDTDQLKKIAKKIANNCAYNIFIEQRHIPVSCRFGIAKYPQDSENSLEIRDLAMTALSYASKHKQETVLYASSMKETLSTYLETEVALIEAIEQEKFELYYQPVIDIKTEKILHCEALIRLKDKDNRQIIPEYMIHVAEELGLIKKITKIVITNVAKQQKIWQKKGLYLTVAVNISSYDVENEEFVDFFEETLRKYGLDKQSIAIEITERTAVQNYAAAQNFLNRMKALGVSVEIDDFGIAHSSLSQITQMEFDTLKIDKSFIDKIMSSEKEKEIVNIIIQMAKVLHVTTLAEGVERKEQYEWLKEHGCDMIQGFYVSKPLCVKDFEAYIFSNPSTGIPVSLET
ncbi:EAL domain-containing protein [Sulfurimonas sp. SWIR-19]|uniref:EAL domain-containing protein n=1 Tax=Sulfurimonas sp. SWIR-19 TaxID=2878390 RepID=UPI001CF5331C|nr:EAL domain-containing protein [Sulfurimonas sp. SWIR-19]UCN00174.1 EAL domain-containing protein [Sulfurimonas sp. SWIR-19]